MTMFLTSSRTYTRPQPVPKMPAGLMELMEGMTREVLKHNPPDVYEFCTKHMGQLLLIRDGNSPKKHKLTLDQKIKRAQAKVRENAEQRKRLYDEAIKNIYGEATSGTNAGDENKTVTEDENTNGENQELQGVEENRIPEKQNKCTENVVESKLKAPINHEKELVEALEVEIFHKPLGPNEVKNEITELNTDNSSGKEDKEASENPPAISNETENDLKGISQIDITMTENMSFKDDTNDVVNTKHSENYNTITNQLIEQNHSLLSNQIRVRRNIGEELNGQIEKEMSEIQDHHPEVPDDLNIEFEEKTGNDIVYSYVNNIESLNAVTKTNINEESSATLDKAASFADEIPETIPAQEIDSNVVYAKEDQKRDVTEQVENFDSQTVTKIDELQKERNAPVYSEENSSNTIKINELEEIPLKNLEDVFSNKEDKNIEELVIIAAETTKNLEVDGKECKEKQIPNEVSFENHSKEPVTSETVVPKEARDVTVRDSVENNERLESDTVSYSEKEDGLVSLKEIVGTVENISLAQKAGTCKEKQMPSDVSFETHSEEPATSETVLSQEARDMTVQDSVENNKPLQSISVSYTEKENELASPKEILGAAEDISLAQTAGTCKEKQITNDVLFETHSEEQTTSETVVSQEARDMTVRDSVENNERLESNAVSYTEKENELASPKEIVGAAEDISLALTAGTCKEKQITNDGLFETHSEEQTISETVVSQEARDMTVQDSVENSERLESNAVSYTEKENGLASPKKIVGDAEDISLAQDIEINKSRSKNDKELISGPLEIIEKRISTENDNRETSSLESNEDSSKAVTTVDEILVEDSVKDDNKSEPVSTTNINDNTHKKFQANGTHDKIFENRSVSPVPNIPLKLSLDKTSIKTNSENKDDLALDVQDTVSTASEPAKTETSLVGEQSSVEENIFEEGMDTIEVKTVAPSPASIHDKQNSMDLETAAVTIQKVFRSFLFKRSTSDVEGTNSIEEDSEKSEVDFPVTTAPTNKERRILGISRMDTVLQTVNEEKSLSLSTDDSSLSSAATIIQSHVRGFLVRNRLDSSRTNSASLGKSEGPSTSLEAENGQKTSKTILNIHIIPEGGHFMSRDESLLTSMELSLDGSPPSSTNLHPLGYDKSEPRKQLKREDAIQSISPPSNNSGKLSEESTSVKESSDEHQKIDSFVNEPGQDDESRDDSPTKSTTIETVIETHKIIKDLSTEPTEDIYERCKGSLEKAHSDENDVICEDKSSNDSDATLGLLHSGEFHDIVLPTKVYRSDTTVVRGE